MSACEVYNPTANADTSLEAQPTEILPPQGVEEIPSKIVEAEPTQIATPTAETITTQKVFPGASDSSFLAVPGVPEDFGGTGEIAELFNNQQIQDNLNSQGYAPIVSRGGVLSRTQFQYYSRVCIANLPEKFVSQAVPGEEDLKIKSESGVVLYGDRQNNEVRVKAVGVISNSGLPEDWKCVNAVITDATNPAGLGALRMLVIDPEGNIMAEMPASFGGGDEIFMVWEETGPKVYVNGDLTDFDFKEGAEELLPPPTPKLGEPVGDFEYNYELYTGSEDYKGYVQPLLVKEIDKSRSGIANLYTSVTLAVTKVEKTEDEWKIEMGFIYRGRLYSYPVEFGGYPAGGTDIVTSVVSLYPDGYFRPRDTSGKRINSYLDK